MDTWDTFGDDWEQLPDKVREDLGKFLERLQRNPYDPDVQRGASLNEGERFSYEFSSDYLLYWRVDCDSMSLESEPRVSLTGLARIKKKH